jgi:hypothetical protein
MERKLTINYNNYIVKVVLSSSNTNIEASWRLKSISDMKAFLLLVRDEISTSEYKYAVQDRSLFSMINEWRVHNLCYSLGIYKSRTCSVDLNIGSPWYIKTLYTILSPLYLHFF